jgi:hypothetical protein
MQSTEVLTRSIPKSVNFYMKLRINATYYILTRAVIKVRFLVLATEVHIKPMHKLKTS